MRGAPLVLVLLIACADSRLPGIADYMAARQEAYCAYYVRCGALPDLESCAGVVAIGQLDPDLVAAVAADKVVWHDEVAYDCIERIANRSCDQTSEASRVLGCGRIGTGTIGDGEVCAFHLECISGECYVPTCEEACCTGTCIGETPLLPGQLGEPCYLAGCAEGWCDGSFCESFRIEGEACEWDHECGYGLACEYPAAVCSVLPGPGESCVDRCRDIGTACSRSFRCEPVGAPGSPCEGEASCGWFMTCGPDTDYTCNLKHTEIGEPCDSFPFTCADPEAYCRFEAVSAVCTLRAPHGAACTHDDECASRRCDELGACSSAPCI